MKRMTKTIRALATIIADRMSSSEPHNSNTIESHLIDYYQHTGDIVACRMIHDAPDSLWTDFTRAVWRQRLVIQDRRKNNYPN